VQSSPSRVVRKDQAPERLPFTGVPDRITQAIRNPISNVLQHTAMNVALSQAHDITLEVQDSRPGLPTDHPVRIFDRFHPVDASRSRSSGGSGLDLAIVCSMIELHGNEVRVRNAHDDGTVFSVIDRDSERKPAPTRLEPTVHHSVFSGCITSLSPSFVQGDFAAFHF
jgi:signal transduction histidine kinase